MTFIKAAEIFLFEQIRMIIICTFCKHAVNPSKFVTKFVTQKERETREKSDKKYRHARQHARALRKGNTPPSSLSSNSVASPAIVPKLGVQCRKSKSYF